MHIERTGNDAAPGRGLKLGGAVGIPATSANAPGF